MTTSPPKPPAHKWHWSILTCTRPLARLPMRSVSSKPTVLSAKGVLRLVMRARGRLARQRFVSYSHLEFIAKSSRRKKRRKPTRRSKILGGFLETLRIVCPTYMPMYSRASKCGSSTSHPCKNMSCLATCFCHTFKASVPTFWFPSTWFLHSWPLLNSSPPICTNSRQKSKSNMSQQEQQLEEEAEEGFGPVLVTKLQVNA